MTLRQLEHATGISRAILSQIENGLRCPTSRQTRLIAAVLGVDAARLAIRAFLVVEEQTA
jgi:transcriptional regulator with XRE-family HTH domain